MNVLPLAADSLGVRSMATLIEAGGARVLIDPGVTLSEARYGLPPSQEELHAQEEATARVIGALCQVDAVIVTHYHDDHANLLPYVLSSTAVYLKTPVTASERRATQDLFPRLRSTGRSFALVEGSSLSLGGLTLTFSPPLPHGKPRARAGSVMAVAVRSREGCFIHGSDIQGPLAATAVEWILRQRPDLLYLSGAPTYRLYYQAERDPDSLTVQDVRTARANLLAIMKYTGCQVLLDHYVVRDVNFRRLYREVLATGQAWTAAEFLGAPERLLEARRRDQDSHEVGITAPRSLRNPYGSHKGPGALAGLSTRPTREEVPVVTAPVFVGALRDEEGLRDPTPCL